MHRFCAWLVVVALTLAAPTTRADQLAEPDAWLARVRGSIERTEPGELLEALKAAAPPQKTAEFEADAGKAVEMLARHLSARRPAYVDVLRDERHGATFRRVDLSAWYEGFDFVFYGLDLFRLERGWIVINFEVSNNLNKMMTRPFPKAARAPGDPPRSRHTMASPAELARQQERPQDTK